MKILITGATGFIGSYLTKKLSGLNIEFIPLSSKTDIRNRNELNQFKDSGITHVIHLSAKNFVPDSWTNPNDFFEVNVGGTMNVLEFCRANEAKLIFISSYIYGPPQYLPINEIHPVNVFNPYALSKKLAEECCQFYSENYNINCCIIRPFNIYGPNQNDQFLIPLILKQVLFKDKIEIMDITPKRDYIYIDDFIDSIISLLPLNAKFEVVNVGSGKSYSVKEIIDIAQGIVKTHKEIISKNEIRKNEIPNVEADISKIKKLTNWQPKTDIYKGIGLFLSHLQILNEPAN